MMWTVARGLAQLVRARQIMWGPKRPTWDARYETLALVLHHYARRSVVLPVGLQRRIADGVFETSRLAKGVRREDLQVAGVPAAWFRRDDADEDRVLLYLHGGGYSIGSIDSHADIVARLCRVSGMTGISVGYRLAPEHRFPAQLEDAMKVYRWLLDEGFEPGRIALAGESAGGGLTVSTLLKARDEGLPLPGAAVCISPWFDLEALGASVVTNAPYDYLDARTLRSFARRFVQPHQLRDPLAAPLYADLEGLPPMLLHVGGAEVLLDDATRFAARAEEAGVTVELEIFEDMIHAWHVYAWLLPQGREAIEAIGRFLRRRVG